MKIYKQLIILIMTGWIFGVPAKPGLIQLIQPDGTEFSARLIGDEWQNWKETTDGYTIAQNENGTWNLVSGYEDGAYVLTDIPAHERSRYSLARIEKHIRPPRLEPGTIDDSPFPDLKNLDRTVFTIPLLLIEYPDFQATYTREDFDSLMNQIGYSSSQGATGGFRDYYLEVSYGQFDPNSVVAGWYEAQHSYLTYGDGAPNGYYYVRQMIAEAVDEAEAQGMDWSQFDNDGDGYVDALNVVHAGPGAEEGNGNFIWSHKWNLGDFARFYDGVWISAYTVNPEIQGSSQNMVHRGVICHEFGHALGLPDLYDIDYSSSGIGTWALMSGGSWGGNGSSPWYPAHMCAWSKEQLGWVSPIVVTDPTLTVNMPNVEENPLVYRMNGTGNPAEYFLFENRQKIGSDQTLIESGLLIWHIDSSVSCGGNGCNSDEWHRKVDLEQADGQYDLNYGFGSDMGDPYPGSTGNTQFAYHTEPNSRYYSDGPSGVSAVNITESNQMITVTFRNLPTLVFEDFSINEYDGDNDGNTNPGETGGLTFVLYNPSTAPVSAINGIFSSDDPYITLLNNNITFDDIEPFGYSANPQELVISIAEDAPLGEHTVQVNLEGTSGGEEFSQTLMFTFEIHINQAGFPLSLESKVISSPLSVDLDGDGSKEVVFGDYTGKIHAVYADGNPYPGNWPVTTGNQIWGAPAAADLDNDGDTEIVVTSKDKKLYVLSSDGSIETIYNANQFLIGTPAIGNVDDDAELEIIFASMSSSGKLFVINPDGSDVEGFPYPLNEKVYESVALADFDGNGKVDMVVGTDSYHLFLIYDDGTLAEGFPFTTSGKIRTSPAIFDLDQDGYFEILLGCDDGFLHLIRDDGSILFTVNTGAVIRSSPSVMQLDDEIMIFFGNDDGFLYGINGFGENLPGWPVELGEQIRSGSIFADLDNDQIPEVITTVKTGGVYIHRLSAEPYNEDFPMSIGTYVECSPIVSDLDGDGDMEIITGYDDGIAAIDLKTPGYPESWSMYQADSRRTGFAPIAGIQLMYGDLTNDGTVDILDIVRLVAVIMGDIQGGPFEILLGDMNGDGSLDVSDAIILVGMII